MRQYKFRGKPLPGSGWGEGWIVGCLYYDESGVYIKPSEKGGRFGCGCPVIPETVGISLCLPDKNDKEIYEGDIVEGHMGWCTGDGYLKKIYPRKIRIRMEVVFNPKGWEAGFHLYEIGVHPDDRLARKDNFYRDVEYRLQESQGPWVNNEPNYLGKCTTLEVVGNKFDNPELYNL